MSLNTVNFKRGSYFEAEDLIREVYTPCMKESEKLNILSAFFGVESLIEISEGLEQFINKKGKISLVISVPEKGMGEHDISLLKAHTEEYINTDYSMFERQLLSEVGFLRKEIEKNKIALIAWLIKREVLEAKLSIRETGYNHWKIYTFQDSESNVVAVSSSMNFTGLGMSNNQSNNSTISLSWVDDGLQESAWRGLQDKFDKVWNNEDPKSETINIDSDLAQKLLDEIGNPDWESIKGFFEIKNRKEFYYNLKTSPAFLEYNLGYSSLMPHQVEAVSKTFESWPIRQLFADEVGLGKTLEVGATIAYLTREYIAKRIVILCPKAVMKQWQDEMSNHFGLNFWTYDSSKKHWIDSVGIIKPKTTNGKSYTKEHPNFVIISKDYARGPGKDTLFKDVEEYPDLLVLDEAHHARASRKTRSFKRTLLRKMLENVKDKIPHIVFASATPMRTHPDEYYYLMELLSLNRFIDSKEYLKSLESLSLKKEEWEVSDLSHFVKILSNTIKWCEKIPQRYLNKEEEDFLLKIKNNEIGGQDFQTFLENQDLIYNLAIKFNPVSFFTSRSSRKILEKYKETYSFPERILEETPIKENDIYHEFEIFYNELMRYADTNYLLAEKSMGKSLSTTAFAKAGFKQSFVSSFYSALQRIKNRKETVETYLKKIEEEQLSDLIKINEGEDVLDEEIEDDSLEGTLEDDITEEEFELLNKENLITDCMTELASIEQIIELGNDIIETKAKEEEEPDPKIIAMVNLIKKKVNKSDKPILIFAHYLATLDNAYASMKKTLDISDIGIGMFKGTEIWYEIGEKRYPADRNQIKNLLFSGELKILFCSEAASEGINLQAADMMINMDVPWVPSVLEQRIGRIARLGQKSKKVTIHNLWYPNSYEAKMYTALLKRQDLMELAMGHFPSIVSDAIKNQVELDDINIKSALKELDDLKSESSFNGLSRLWEFDKGTHEPYGDNFRKRLIKISTKLGLDSSNYSFAAGDENVINLRSKILKEFILDNEVSQKGKNSVYMLINKEKKLIGFVYENKESNRKIINPRFLPELLEGIYTGTIKNLNKMIIDIDIPSKITDEDLLSIYSKEVPEWLVPQHRKVRKDEEGYKYESSELEFVELAKIN